MPLGKADIELINLDTGVASQTSQRKKGINVKVLFEMTESGTTRLSGSSIALLSPGQRTVVSVCLLFGLQKCSSCPFYCFDEIDADLDVTYCETLSQM